MTKKRDTTAPLEASESPAPEREADVSDAPGGEAPPFSPASLMRAEQLSAGKERPLASAFQRFPRTVSPGIVAPDVDTPLEPFILRDLARLEKQCRLEFMPQSLRPQIPINSDGDHLARALLARFKAWDGYSASEMMAGFRIDRRHVLFQMDWATAATPAQAIPDDPSDGD